MVSTATIIHSVGDDRPAVILATLESVNLVTAARAMLGLPKGTRCWVSNQPLRVAIAVGPDRRIRVRLAGKGVILGDSSVIMDAVNFTIRPAQVLSLVHRAAVADSEKEKAILKYESSPEMNPS